MCFSWDIELFMKPVGLCFICIQFVSIITVLVTLLDLIQIFIFCDIIRYHFLYCFIVFYTYFHCTNFCDKLYSRNSVRLHFYSLHFIYFYLEHYRRVFRALSFFTQYNWPVVIFPYLLPHSRVVPQLRCVAADVSSLLVSVSQLISALGDISLDCLCW